jgi:hypothetical protein
MPEGFPVVIVESGGVPVVQVEENAPLATVAANGLGMAITLVEANGIPLIIQEGN